MTRLWQRLHPTGPGITSGAAYGILILFVLTLVLAAANLMITAREVSGLRAAVISTCKFNADIGAAPITVNPATHKASLLGVSIVADARQSWHGLHCPGKLPPPEPSFVKWAKVYRLPYR